MTTRRTLILGLGNPLMSDDAVGILVARGLHERLADPDVELREAAVAGIELMELLVGYDRAVIIDAVQTAEGKPGDWYRLDGPQKIEGSLPQSSHRFGVFEGLELGRRLGLAMPGEIRIYAVEAPDPFTFGEGLTPALAAALPGITTAIYRELAG
ncbi:MAG TPA: hydrogenase maturation protease [Candidatus Coatesbacteria bacterium]|nr:hydrogenase maturation protease [Candidatus Coatesbacteria bacterium]